VRILHIVPSLAPQTGGPSQSVPALCRAVARQGHDVTLYTSTWPHTDKTLPPKGVIQTGDGFAIRTFPSKRGSFGSSLPHSPDLLQALDRHADRFDIIVTHSLWNPVATFSRKLLRNKGRRYCIMPHGMLDPVVFKRNGWKKFLWARLWERKNVEEASLIIFNTLAEKEKAGYCGWHLPACITVPHVIDLSGWRDLPPRSSLEGVFPQLRGREVILFVGRINWVKNLDTLLDALAIVRKDLPSAMLVCVGPSDDRYRAELERKAQIMGLRDALLFTGMLVGRALKTAYARGDLLALVSKKENFGLAVAEALAAGLPVVVSTGVDLAAGWPSEGPVRRVEAAATGIARAIEELLERSHSYGLPDKEAQALAEKELGGTRIHHLIESYRSVVNG